MVGLVGENGAGKSTLMRILAGVYQPDAGEILLDGKPVRLANAADANRMGIGMVFQEQSLLLNLTVGENIYLGHEDAVHPVRADELGARSTPPRAGSWPRSSSTSIRARAPRTSTSPRARWSNSPRR